MDPQLRNKKTLSELLDVLNDGETDIFKRIKREHFRDLFSGVSHLNYSEKKPEKSGNIK